MASSIMGVKTGKPTSKGMPAKVESALKAGYPKRYALSMGPKPVSSVKVK